MQLKEKAPTATPTSTPSTTSTPAPSSTPSGSCAGLPAFQTCTAYSVGTSVGFGGNKYTAIGTISSTRDCPPASPYDPATDNWWRNDGPCS